MFYPVVQVSFNGASLRKQLDVSSWKISNLLYVCVRKLNQFQTFSYIPKAPVELN